MCACCWQVSGSGKLFSHFAEYLYANKRLAVRPLKSLSLFRELHAFQPNSGLLVGVVMDICGFVAVLQTMCVLFQQPGAPLFQFLSSGLIKFAPIYSYALISISSSAQSFVLSVTNTHVCKKIQGYLEFTIQSNVWDFGDMTA